MKSAISFCSPARIEPVMSVEPVLEKSCTGTPFMNNRACSPTALNWRLNRLPFHSRGMKMLRRSQPCAYSAGESPPTSETRFRFRSSM